ncbi:hypothetical protein EVG20_g5428 [Dentipellis fragilis]|uniref:FAD-binding domain-containing protein n=1 Tax=Dentipellis fragilis TaxID=205917 RepID=A0A4Y9YVP9_9AGAM|nr:hypothetical protein EVG20_g5428 [Dentipellis fragilis]
MSSFDIDVLVVGSGPSGLVAAIVLAQSGVSVRIIEKLSEYPVGQRGSGIMPRTLETYHFLGVLDEVKNVGMSPPDFQEWVEGKPTKTFPIMPHQEATPAFPERNPMFLGQDAACRILRDRLSTYNVQVELSTEFFRLDQGEGHVVADVIQRQGGNEVQQQITAKYVIGADGAKGIVHKLLNLSLLGETREETHILVGEVEAFGIDAEHWHWFKSGGVPPDGCMLRPTDRTATENIFSITCFGVGFDIGKALEDYEYLRQFAYGVAQIPALKIGKVETAVDYRPNIRVVNKLSEGRVFIVGDAGHVHSPSGGQGMNSSIMDSFNLAWKIALACKGLASDKLLDSYNEERLPVIKEMLLRTTAILDDTIATSKTKGGATWKRSAKMNQLSIHYRWSPIVVDEEVEKLHSTDKAQAEAETGSTYDVQDGDRLHAGDRAPDAPDLVDVKTGEAKRLFNVFGPAWHTILIFADGDDKTSGTPIMEWLSRYPKELVRTVVVRSQSSSSDAAGADLVLQDKEGHAYSAYGAALTSSGVAIVRPDSVVGALVEGRDGVEKYFSRVFGV